MKIEKNKIVDKNIDRGSWAVLIKVYTVYVFFFP